MIISRLKIFFLYNIIQKYNIVAFYIIIEFYMCIYSQNYKAGSNFRKHFFHFYIVTIGINLAARNDKSKFTFSGRFNSTDVQIRSALFG